MANVCSFSGMSEKLQSIPKETIQVAPKEVALPPVPSGPDQNGFLTELRGKLQRNFYNIHTLMC